MGAYILSMACVSCDELQVAIHRREDIVPWLKKLDHEGSHWTVCHHVWDGDRVVQTDDLTDEIMQEYGKP